MRDLPQPRLPGRRSVLAGIVGAATLALTGCGLRVDKGPQVPTPTAADDLRNRAATLLSGVRASGGQQRAVTTLAKAIGPVWTSPTATASPSPAAKNSTTPQAFGTALDLLVTDVTGEFPQGDPATGLGTVLADVAVGSALALVVHAHADATTLGKRFTALAKGQGAGATSGAAASASQDQDDEAAPEHPLATYARTCFQASAGYERIAAVLPAGDAYRTFATGRGQALDLAAATTNGLLHDAGRDAVANRPSWKFSINPKDLASGQKLARSLEDALASALPGLLTGDVAPRFACSQLWATGWARHRAGGTQLLRFAYTGQTPGAASSTGAPERDG